MSPMLHHRSTLSSPIRRQAVFHRAAAGISLPPAPSSRRVTTRALRTRNARPTHPLVPARRWDHRWPRIHSRQPTKLQPPGPLSLATRTRQEFLAALLPAPITETAPGV